MWVVRQKVFQLKLDELSCKGQDQACGMEEMSSDAIGVEGTKHPPTHILSLNVCKTQCR